MNNTIKLAVASALLAAASSANAGISIPAGDWTLDIGGVVNAYYTHTSFSGDSPAGAAPLGLGDGDQDSTSNITTGLLPNYLSVSGKTRQNDLDVGFTISINPGASTTNGGRQSAQQENRQAFLTFGDASWGSIKLGKDLGIYASDAILNDMTLLGVGGAGQNRSGTTTLGGIGSGYLYADWKAQVSYTSPNWNGFSFQVGVMQPWDVTGSAVSNTSTSKPGFEGQVTYEWAGDVGGKVWAGAIYQKIEDIGATGQFGDETARGFDIGATVNVAGFGLTGYYYDGKGLGTTGFLANALSADGKRRDSDGGYVQATYTIPGAGTKLGLAYGVSNLDDNAADAGLNLVDSNERWTVGAYHPLTKHLNLVAEYNRMSSESHKAGVKDADNDNISLGAILFF